MSDNTQKALIAAREALMVATTPLADDRQKVLHALNRLDAALAAQPQQAQVPQLIKGGAVYGIIDPDYGRVYTIVRKISWEEGYAIGLHGSFTRDLDMIAVPWTERCCEPEHLVRRILMATGLREAQGNPGRKPHNRKVWTLLFPEFGDPRFVDLSIIASQEKPE